MRAHAQGDAVVAALAGLFRRFEAEGNGQQAPGSRAVVAPTALREALHALDAAAFRLGEMSDAAEVLTAIYDSLRRVRARALSSGLPLPLNPCEIAPAAIAPAAANARVPDHAQSSPEALLMNHGNLPERQPKHVPRDGVPRLQRICHVH